MSAEARLRGLDRAWRVLATGLSFAAFGLGGLVAGVVVAPLMLVLVRDPARRRRLARRGVQRGFALQVAIMRRLGVLTVSVSGAARLQREGLLVLANHPTLIDVVLLVALLPDADCVVKRAVARNPFMRATVRAAGYIVNDDGPALVEAGIATVCGGGCLVDLPRGHPQRARPAAETAPRRGQHRRARPAGHHPGTDTLHSADAGKGAEMVSCAPATLPRFAGGR